MIESSSSSLIETAEKLEFLNNHYNGFLTKVLNKNPCPEIAALGSAIMFECFKLQEELDKKNRLHEEEVECCIRGI